MQLSEGIKNNANIEINNGSNSRVKFIYNDSKVTKKNLIKLTLIKYLT